jgi:hypothetical protein
VRKTEPGHRAWSGDWNSAKNNEREGSSNITAGGKTSSGIFLSEKTLSQLHGERLVVQDRKKSDKKNNTSDWDRHPELRWTRTHKKKILPHQATEQKFLNQRQTPRCSQN